VPEADAQPGRDFGKRPAFAQVGQHQRAWPLDWPNAGMTQSACGDGDGGLARSVLRLLCAQLAADGFTDAQILVYVSNH